MLEPHGESLLNQGNIHQGLPGAKGIRFNQVSAAGQSHVPQKNAEDPHPNPPPEYQGRGKEGTCDALLSGARLPTPALPRSTTCHDP